MASGTLAFVLSSTGIVIFGEIVPQSACAKYALAIGARTIWITKLMMIVTAPLSWPISKLNLVADLRIAVGAIEIVKKNVKDVMTKIEHVFMLSEDDVLDNQMIEEIIDKGYSRIPVYEGIDRSKVKSFVMIRDFVLLDKKSNLTVKVISDFHRRKIRVVDENMPVTELLEEFKVGHYHMALVSGEASNFDNHSKNSEKEINDNISISEVKQESIPLINIEDKSSDKRPKEFVGLVTLEDIVEEILQSEIVDESDSILDNVQRNKRKVTKMQLNQLMTCESLGDPLSFNMRNIVTKWLHEHHEIFGKKYFEPRALENLIQKNIRQVVVSSQRRQDQAPVMLYEYLMPSKRFILILEGKAKCLFPRSNMSFEIGPWTSFGDLLIEKAYECWKKGDSDIIAIPYSKNFEIH
ncbi:hypothetical protein WR25_01507 [Diploscapter pachys]|uniref:CNNM transmembrane domain-containing protein n=1 Tax=Diploscapter pachys TaxID=2018661 RepID=A0A2A2J157_9BILA|nr:hypothetical protein WR25_01507 [Diploscapter pachys]